MFYMSDAQAWALAIGAPLAVLIIPLLFVPGALTAIAGVAAIGFAMWFFPSQIWVGSAAFLVPYAVINGLIIAGRHSKKNSQAASRTAIAPAWARETVAAAER